MPAKLTEKEFWGRSIEAPSGCLEWSGGTQKHRGYGVTSFHGKAWLAHRLAWTLCFGEIPDGLCVCHKCDNRKCIRPDHLFLGSQSDNMADMKKKGRRKNINLGQRNGRSKISELQAKEIYDLYHSGQYNQVQLASMYPVSQSMVSCIVRGAFWKQVNCQ